MANANIVKKVSMKSLIGNVKAFIPVKEISVVRGDKTVIKEVPDVGGETVWLANIVGIARNIKRGTSQFGEWEALIGDFMAEVLAGDKVGKRFRTGQIFLPDVVMNMIAGSMTGEAIGIQFNFKVGIVAADTEGERASATGYEYVADFLVTPSVTDPLETLLDQAQTLALPAPEGDPNASENEAYKKVDNTDKTK